MERSNFSRRDFSKLGMAALGGLAAGLSAPAFGAEDKGPWMGEKHICRGLNACKGLGAGAQNDCAGTGACATVKKHGCGGDNECKYLGGCGEKPGENACKGQGKCSVPLDEDAWPKARKSFESAMAKAGKKFGAAPSKK